MRDDFRTLLMGAVAVPVHWRKQPTLQKQIPYVNLSAFMVPEGYSLDGQDGASETVVQVDCWAEAYSAADALADQVKAALTGYKGTVGGTEFQGIFAEGERDLGGDVPLASGERTLFARSADYRVVHS